MYTLHGEIEKLCSSPAQSPITKDDVLKYCCPNESYKVYEISDALLRGDMNKVKRALDNLAAVKTEPSMLLGYLSRIYSDMLIVQAGLEESKGYGQIARLVGKPDWMVRRIASGLSGKPAGYITFACEAIDIADRKMKRYGINPYLVLEILLIRIGLYGYAK